MNFLTMGRHSYKAALGFVLVAAAIATGCGGGDDSSTTTTVTTSSMTKAQFVKQANKICSSKGDKIVEDVGAFQAPKSAEGDPVEIVTKSVMVPGYKKIIAEVQGLGAPKGDEAQVEAFLQAMQKALDEDEANPAPSLGVLFSKIEQNFRTSGDLARKYGIVECAYG